MTYFARKTSRVSMACTSSLGLLLAGCGIQTDAPISQPANASIKGTAMGGSFPIIGATVNLWATQSAGYPTSSTTGTPLATAVTNASGNFSFDPVGSPYTCPTGQYAYLTVSGGHTGSLTSNNQSVLMAALGSCSNFSSPAAENNISIYVSEVSTVAAAYALSNFMYIGGAAGSQTVYVSAPANNNATAPACTGSGFTMACTAAGIGHAFANAANLANVVSFSAGVPPTGSAYSVPPTNSAGSVPQALINTLANVLEYCVNSTGGVAGDGTTHCGNLFSATTAGGITPTNTLQAAINMAKYPTNNVSTIYGFVSSTGSFSPNLVSAPTDFSMAIVYKGDVAGGTTTPYLYPTTLALDSADDVFVVVADSTPPSQVQGSAAPTTPATMSGVSGLSSAGSTIFSSSMNTSTNFKAPGQAASDNLGHLWLADTGAAGTFRGLNTLDGSVYANITTTAGTNPVTPALASPTQIGPYGLGIDRANNLWTCRKGGTAVFEFTYTAGSPATYANGSSGSQTVSCGNVSFDTSQNIWYTSIVTSTATPPVTTTTVGALANSNSTGTPSYAGGATKRTTLTTLTADFGTAWNSSGIGFTTTNAGILGVTPTLSTATPPVVTAATNSSAVTKAIAIPGLPAFDGANTLFYTDAGAGGPLTFVTNPTANGALTAVPTLAPCYLPGGANTCAATSPVMSAQTVQVDSTGSLWVVSGVNGALTQLIGTAAPTWPALYYGHPGVMPQ